MSAHKLPIALILIGLALHFPGWLWHEVFHGHEGLETLWTQAGFYFATAVLLTGALVGVARTRAGRLRAGYAAVLAGAMVETAGWVWDFAAHYGGREVVVAHSVVYLGAAIAVLAALATTIIWRADSKRRA